MKIEQTERENKMSESKHTPGPWVIKKSALSYFIDARLKGSTMQEVAYIGATEINEQQGANARLISAAPDLLEALEFMLSEFGKQDGHTDYSAIDKAEAAIKKAKGLE